MTLIVGVDPSAKKIALVAKHTVLNVARVQSYPLYKTREKQTPESIHRALLAMEDFLTGVADLSVPGQRFAWVETPLVGRGGVTTTMKQAYVGGVIRACLVQHGFAVYDANPSTWRSTLGIKGKGTVALKANTARVVKTRWPKIVGLIDGDGDLTDAAAIALHGEQQVHQKGLLVGHAGPATGAVPGRGPRKVVRKPRMRSGL